MSKKNLSDDSTAKADIEPSASTPLRESPRLGSLAEGTPLAYAIEANQNLEVSKFSKFLRKVKADKRPALKHLNLARKNKKQQRHFSRQFKGKVIDGQHELYILTYGMMLGLRCAVGRNITEEADLTLDDFCYVEKLNFPPLGYNGERQAATPPHKLAHTFKFKTYSPLVFRRIRTYFNIDPVSFTQSVCGNSNFIEFISNSKSGQFFFYSADGRYMIKTQTTEENRFMRRILPHYYKYVSENPHTLLVRIFGMYRVKMYHLRRKVHFVIMGSVFDTPEDIHQIFDLKGSRIGRSATEKEKASGGVLKDNDLVEGEHKFYLGPKKKMLLEQISRDAMFLASLNIMDYSLLVGTHDRMKRSQEPYTLQKMDGTTPHSNLKFRLPASTVLEDQLEHAEQAVDKANKPPPPPPTQNRPASGSDDFSGKAMRRRSVKTIRLPKHAISGVSAAHSDETTDDEEEFDLDGHYDDGDSELEQEIDEVQIAPQADTTGTPPPRVLPSTRLSLLAAGSPLDGANVPQIDPEADPLKWYYDLSVRSLQRSYHSAGDLQELNDRSKADDAKKHQDAKMKARLSVIIKRSASEGMAEDREIALKKGPKGELGELVEEKEGVGLGKEGRGVNNVLRFSPPPLERFSDALIETLPPVLSPRHSVDGSGKQSLFRKQIKLVKHTFGPGVGVRHPWTARGDTGINARVFLSEDKSIVSRPTPVHGRANEIYFMGIIDILQQYNTVKRVENFFKGFSHDPAMISAVPAIQYAERFVAFLSEHIV